MTTFDCSELCRLCLVKDRVKVPIFEGEGDARQVSFKIGTCLPIKVTREDRFPKQVCEDCINKLDLVYDFWTTTVNSERQLSQWVGDAGDGEDKQGYVSITDELMKQETAENRLMEGSVMNQNDQNTNININMMDQMGLTMPIIISNNQQQQQQQHQQMTMQGVSGTSSDANQRGNKRHHEEVEASDDEGDIEGLDNDDAVKSEDIDGTSNRPTGHEPTFVSIACDDGAGPSGLQQQKMDMSDMIMTQADVDPKSGREIVEKIVNTPSAEYRLIVVCKPSGEKTTSLILGDKEIARDIPVSLPSKDPLSETEQYHPFGTVSCPICNRKFANEIAVQKHTISAHKSAYKCKHCDTKFYTQAGLDQHLTTHTEPMIYLCSQCKKKYKRRDSLNLHILRAHSKIEGKFTCEECTKTFHLKADLTAHLNRAHTLQECRFCHKAVKDLKNHEDEHKKKNADIIDENCELCGQKFRSKAKYDVHRKKHKEGKNLECKECNLVFPGHRALINHRDREHRSGTTCEICKKVFYSITNYYQHVLVHAGIKPYKCDVCGENFSQRTSLKRHREKHEGPLPPFDEVTRIAHLAKEYLDTLE